MIRKPFFIFFSGFNKLEESRVVFFFPIHVKEILTKKMETSHWRQDGWV